MAGQCGQLDSTFFFLRPGLPGPGYCRKTWVLRSTNHEKASLLARNPPGDHLLRLVLDGVPFHLLFFLLLLLLLLLLPLLLLPLLLLLFLLLPLLAAIILALFVVLLVTVLIVTTIIATVTRLRSIIHIAASGSNAPFK